MNPGAAPIPENGGGSPFVPAQPVWALVRRRQAQWGYSDDDMATFLGLGGVIDVRGLMLRPTAERILRRLAEPAPATAGTRKALTIELLTEASRGVIQAGSDEAERIQAELRGEAIAEAAPADRRAS
ncbi:MAG: hypothetical protein JWP02_1813 [Acidimicrobiales bacterium]|nr:hypothetical protein [Acidimicrobiales bacterium]